MIFLPRFKSDTLRRAQGLPTAAEQQTQYSQLRKQLGDPRNVPAWANLNVGALQDQNLQSTMDSFQFHRNAQATAPQPRRLTPVTSWGSNANPQTSSQTQQRTPSMRLPRFGRGSSRRPSSTFSSFGRANARDRGQYGAPFQSYRTTY